MENINLTDRQKIAIEDIKKSIIYIKSDLIRLVKEIEPKDNTPGDCNFPIILFCLTSIEFLGTLCFDDSTDEQRSKKYIEKYFFDDNNKRLIINFETISFIQVFRNGLSHHFYAKFGYGIQRKSEEVLFKNKENKLILGTNKFIECFLKSLSLFEEKIADDSFQYEISNRYLKLISDDNKKYEIFSSKLPINNFNIVAANASTSSYDLCPSAANTDIENIYDQENYLSK